MPEEGNKKTGVAMNEKECLLFYVKFPEHGKVKTRLAKGIGDEHALVLYKCFVLDILDTLASISRTICVCYAPENYGRAFKAWLGEEYLYFPQQGENLGERMRNSFQQAFQHGFGKALLIGSDLPDLPSHLIVKAFEQLCSFDSVIGPASDGGYYLLGFRKETFFSEVFQGITWSHSSVYADTLKKFEHHGKKFFTLSVWNDIDNLPELQQWWYRHNRNDNSRAMRTLKYLRQIEGLLIVD